MEFSTEMVFVCGHYERHATAKHHRLIGVIMDDNDGIDFYDNIKTKRNLICNNDFINWLRLIK